MKIFIKQISYYQNKGVKGHLIVCYCKLHINGAQNCSMQNVVNGERYDKEGKEAKQS